MSSVRYRNGGNIPVGDIEFQAESPVQHVCGFTDAWFQCDRFRLALQKIKKISWDESFVLKTNQGNKF